MKMTNTNSFEEKVLLASIEIRKWEQLDKKIDLGEESAELIKG